MIQRIRYYQMVRVGQDWEPAEEESEVWAAFNLDQRPKLVNLQASLNIRTPMITVMVIVQEGPHICHICHHICHIYVTMPFSPGKILLPGQTWKEVWNMLWFESVLQNTIVMIFTAKYRKSINALLKIASDFLLHWNVWNLRLFISCKGPNELSMLRLDLLGLGYFLSHLLPSISISRLSKMQFSFWNCFDFSVLLNCYTP